MLRKALSVAFITSVILMIATVPVAMADPASPWSITNVDDPDPVASGAQITYTITMTNTGGNKVFGAVLTDQLNGVGGIGVPPQLQITSSRGSCTQTTTLVTCLGGTVEGRGSWTVTIRGIVVAPSSTVINNTASVGSNNQPQGATSQAIATTLVMGGTGGGPAPDLTISKNGPSSAVVSSTITYLLTVNNIGTVNATGVKVVDTVPAGLTGITATGTSLFVCGVAGQTVTCNGGAVNFGSNATITINATAPATTGTITNTASVDPDNTIAESNELNNTSALVNTAITAAPPTPNLSIDVTDDPSQIAGAGPDPVTPGDLLTYKILVKNNAATRADDVNIVDGTQGLVASSMTVNFVVTNGTIGTFGGCSINGSQAKCIASTLQPGGTILMTVSGFVIQSAGSTLLDTATVTGTVKNKGQSSTDTEITTVKPGIDLTITSVGSPDPVCARSWPTDIVPAPISPPLLAPPVCLGGLTYTFVVGNSGIQTATGVLVRDPLPAGTFFDSFTAPAFAGGCSVDSSNVLTCTDGTIAPQSITTITIVLVAPPGTGTAQNTVYVDPNNAIFEADELNNTATTSTLVKTGIDLTVTKSAKFETIATSGTQTYTITVDNIGPQDATNIRVRDILPANTIFRSALGDHNFTCSYLSENHWVECTGGQLLGTASEFYPAPSALGEERATITIRVFAQPIVGLMTNQVRVDPRNDIAEVNELNNIAFQDTVVAPGGASTSAFNEFTISKTQDSPANPVARNAKVQYTIIVGNDGTDPATFVTVRDFLPAGATYIQATGTNQFLCTAISNVINCTGGVLPANAVDVPSGAATITVTMFAPDTPGSYTNQAIVDPDHAIPEGNEFDNQASAVTVVENAGNGPFYELNIHKTQTSPDETNTARNAVVTYSITVGNTGSDPVNSIVVRDTLPAGSRYISATGDHQFLCNQAVVGVVTCTGGRLPALNAETATITLKMFAPDTPGTYVNQVFVDPDNTIPEGDELNNQATQQTVVADGGADPFNDLTIVKTPNSSTVSPGGTITYTLVVSNLGSDPAQNVRVRDVLPAGETFVSAADTGSGAAFTCSQSGGVVNCTGATVGGAPRTITIVAKAPQALGSLHNEAVVDPNNTIPEGNESNNTSFADVTVTSKINLKVTKSGPTSASQSDVTDYTIVVTNDEPLGAGTGELATGVVLIDPLPVGMIPLATDLGSGNNWACTIDQNPINLVRCIGDLGPGDSNKVTIKITVFITAENGRVLDNVACLDPDNTIVESNELDNCSDVGTFITPAPPAMPDLLVSKNVDSLSTSPGASLQYTISISNVGDAKAKGWDGSTGATVTDTLPSEVDFVNFSTTNAWTCTEASGTVTCHDDGTGMDPGESAEITILVTVKTTANSPITNTGHADPAIAVDCSGPCDNESGVKLNNNDSTITSSIGSTGIDLAIGAITDVPDPVGPGQGLTYTITATNGGTAPADTVDIEVHYPLLGLDINGADGSNGFNCTTPSGGVFTCSGALPAGGTTTITVTFTTHLTGLPPDVTLSAKIDPGDVYPETNEGNNEKSQTTTMSTSTCSICVDLVSSELHNDVEPMASGSTATITYQVINTGDTATGLNPASDALLALFAATDVSIGAATVVSSDPLQFPCSIVLSGAAFSYAECKGNLAPGQGVTITMTVPAATGSYLDLIGIADPGILITEPNETNNFIEQTVVLY